MADNTQLEAAVIPGDILATDDIGGVKYQRVKIALGAADAYDMDLDSGQQSMANSVPVAIASNQTVIPVSDNGGTLTVDGSVVADTELPAAAALADNTANPTAPAVGAFPHVWDGVAWDRLPGNSASGVLVQGTVAVSGSVTVAEPVSVDDNGASLTVDNPTLSVVGGGLEAAALRVTIASDSTGLVSVDDNGGSLTVDGTVAVSAVAGTVTVDSELPAAAALSDNFANPTAPAVGAFGMLWDGATWDRAPGTSALGATINLANVAGAAVQTGSGTAAGSQRVELANNGTGTIASITTSVTPGTAAANLGKAEDAAHTSGDVGVMALAVANEGNTARAADNDYLPIAADTEGNVRVVGNRDHDAVDAGEVLKVGSRATDYEPDTDDTESGGLAEVAENDRVALSLNRRGELIEGVNTKRVSLSALNTTYDDSPTTNVSASEECWNYRWATVSLTIDSTNTPTDLRIDIETSQDGTNFAKLMNGPLGLWIYDDVATATAISRALTFPICAYMIQVRITCTGTTAANTFAVTNAMLFLRN